MSRAPESILAAVRDVWRITFADPVREGHPRPSSWPRGLAAIGLAAMVVYVALALSATFAVPLRQLGNLTVSPTSDHTLPTASLPLLVAGLLLSLTLAHTAALHTSWWLRIPLFVLGATAVFFFTATAYDRPLLVAGSALAYFGLLVFTLVRTRREYAWWEFVVVAGLVATAALLPWAGGGSAATFVDPRPVGLEGALINLQALSLPAIMVAATAPAQIVVTGAVATSTREVSRWVFRAGAVAVVAWFGISVYWAWDDLEPGGLVGAAITLLLVAGGLVLALRRARRSQPEPPAVYPEAWSPWLYPLAIGMAGMLVVMFPFLIVRAMLPMAGLGDSGLAQLLDLLWNAWSDNNPGVLWRALIGLVALGFAWRRGREDRLGEAGFLIAFAAAVLGDAAGLLPGGDIMLDRTALGYGIVAGGVALLAGVVWAIRGRLSRERATGILTVLLLATLYPHRQVLQDPASAVLVFSAPLVILFGLTWRILTDAEFTRSGSPKFPQSTRVLLFLANSLFAVTSVAFLALSRGTGTDVDTTMWAELGDTMLGDPLFVIALVAGTWLVIARAGRSEVSSPPSGRLPSA